MKLTHKDALNILGLNAQATQDEIKAAYRKACSQYHPDRNAAGLEMMQLINVAYEALQDYKGEAIEQEAGAEMYGEQINTALNLLISLGLEIELCGSWIWVHGNSYAHREILKANGFKWAPVKKLWYFRPADYKSFGRGKWDMDKIRSIHGSQKIVSNQRHIAGNA
jgi:hypothetical protein